ncbi:uncharacterized protein LOC110184105 [Drosophila serrata]|uniref:uncharacterized protein LOC110184105 n=1 Tax=Drosophila serrata TaxID=7274 RepID=UPI000A1D1010|nr:uncharacterized protein LOC110184105 [Drosophila serrata]
MGSRYHLLTWHLFSLILVSGQMQIPLDQEETHERINQDISSLFRVINILNNFHHFQCFITYTGTFDLRPSFEQRLMEHFPVPIYSVGSKQGPLNRRYPVAANMVITLFSGIDDPTLFALNDTDLSSDGSTFFSFLYVPVRNVSWDKDKMFEFFSWCWDRKIIRPLLFFRSGSKFETWSYFPLKNITMIRIDGASRFRSIMRSSGFRFHVQVSMDVPTIFWYNSSVQADVIGGGNISLSGPIGTLIVEFMRYINASMDILPVSKSQSDIFAVSSDRRVDMVANLVANDSYLFSPTVTYSRICLVRPLRRMVPFNRYYDKSVRPTYHFIALIVAVSVFGVKYMAHRRRSVVETLFSSVRFAMGIPLPGGQLNRLPLADKILEVYSFLFVGIAIGACVSTLSTALTTGVYYPPIRDVESMRASGLRILTADPTIKQAFVNNQMPSSLADLVDLMDEHTVSQNFIDLNDNYVYVVATPNWEGYQLYQQRLFNKRFGLSGPELCSNSWPMRLPISQYSPLRFIFTDYFHWIFESGLQQKWVQMGFQKYLELKGNLKLPLDEATNWKPLSLDFFTVFIKVYLAGILLSTVVFILELLYNRYAN